MRYMTHVMANKLEKKMDTELETKILKWLTAIDDM